MFFSRILHAILYKPVLRLLQNDSTLKKKLEAEDSTMDVDGCREKSYDASTDGENDLDERAKALKLHEKSKAIILSRKRSLFILTFRVIV